jgi:hypothetical protein
MFLPIGFGSPCQVIDITGEDEKIIGESIEINKNFL